MNEVPVRLLRETLQARVPAGPSQECLDAETVAAWADDTLGRDERRAAEAHAADCGWCQALVAAMAKTAPPAAARSWWRAPVMGWLVPLTAAAAALLVWMNVPGTPPVPSSTSALECDRAGTGPHGPERGGRPTAGNARAGTGEAGCGEGEQPGSNRTQPAAARRALRARDQQERDEQERGAGRPGQGAFPRLLGGAAAPAESAPVAGSPTGAPTPRRRRRPPTQWPRPRRP